MRAGDFADFAIFVAIAEEGSLRAAAARLNLRPSTVSHGLRALEARLGVRLFHRTTRSVALTEAGQALLARIAPALSTLEAADEAVNDFRAHPTGQVRLSVPRGIASCVLLPKLRAFAERFPDVRLDIAAENGFVDIVSAGFDAGVRLGESVARDMVALRITPPVQAVIVAAPDYLARRIIWRAVRRRSRRRIWPGIAVSVFVSWAAAGCTAGSLCATGRRLSRRCPARWCWTIRS